MIDFNDPTVRFYQKHLPGGKLDKAVLTADCPFCRKKGKKDIGKLCVFLNKGSYFFGYFRCLHHCVPGGFPLFFTRLSQIDPSEGPGYDPDRESLTQQLDFPVQNYNKEANSYQERLTPDLLSGFQKAGVLSEVLAEMHIGYNGRYVTYPYFQNDGNCYSLRCVHPEKPEDNFWHGDQNFFSKQFQIFNVQDIHRCENGALFICEGEENLLTIKQLGFPGIALPHSQSFEEMDPQQFAYLKTIFIVAANNPESEASARFVASKLGYKVRLFHWPVSTPRDYNLWQLAKEKKKSFRASVFSMLKSSKAFSPFTSPLKEGNCFFERLSLETGDEYKALRTGFPKMDTALGGVHGLNVIGGAPKVGKSCFMIQIATEMAARGIPLLYYDFENGRQKIYQRTLSRLSRLTTTQMRAKKFSETDQQRYDESCHSLREMLVHFRVINDRKVNPEMMRRHIDFIRHETQSEFTVVVIDSLHKLPFKNVTERRTGIDAWLRQMESIRDDLHVSFLIISELTRGEKGAYREEPHMGLFKGSGDIEYSADNAMVLTPEWEQVDCLEKNERKNKLWLVGSREQSPGLVGEYRLDYPYWGFQEM